MAAAAAVTAPPALAETNVGARAQAQRAQVQRAQAQVRAHAPAEPQAEARAPRRLAVVVGANAAPPGRRPLRYSHEDARRVADVLTLVGGFDRADVQVLLDPTPQALLAAVDQTLRAAAAAAAAPGRDAVMFFYYSGHADEGVLYPAGRPLPMAALKPRLDDARAKLRIGLIDACRGGGWTGTKGLTPAEPFDVTMPLGLATKGSILIASSSGVENAHESEALRGSFFTHHWNGGLRGAADRDGDGRITVAEAFEHARALTIRDTALVTETPQHPSFHMSMGGRQDFTLVSLDARRSVLVLQQRTGPLELVHLETGLVVLESVRGQAVLRLGLTPGHYLVRRRDSAGIWARQVEIPVDRGTQLGEEQLELVRPAPLGVKGDMPRLSAYAVLPPGAWHVGLSFGVRHARVIDPGLRLGTASGDLTAVMRAVFGLAPGWHLALPLAVARAGAGARARSAGAGPEWVLWGGLPVLGATRAAAEGAVITGVLGAGADLRVPFAASSAFNLGAGALGSFRWSQHLAAACDPAAGPCPPAPPPGRQTPSTWVVQLTAGLSHNLGDAVTFNLAAGVAANALATGELPSIGWREPSLDPLLALGSLQRRGLLPLPLIRVHLGETLALDVHVVVAYALGSRALTETYMAGASWFW